MLIGLKKRLVWACLKGVTLQKTFKEESTHKNHYDDNYSASIRVPLLRLNTYQYFAGILCFVKGCHINMMDLNVKQIAHVNIMSDIFLPITRSIPCKKMNNNERDIRHFFQRRKNTKRKNRKIKEYFISCFLLL